VYCRSTVAGCHNERACTGSTSKSPLPAHLLCLNEQLLPEDLVILAANNLPNTLATIERIISLLSTSPEGEVRCRCQNGMAYKD
jgi:hypothetical protein